MTQPVDSIVSQWAVTPTVRAAGPRLLTVHVAYAAVPVAVVETGHGEIELRAHWTAPPDLDDEGLNRLATSTTFARAGQVRCTASAGAIDVAHPVYLEGLTRNAFYAAATEVAKAAVTIDESVRSSRPGPVDAPDRGRPEPVAIDEPEDVTEAVPVARPQVADEPQPQAHVEPEPQPFVEPEPQPFVEPEPEPRRFDEPEPQREIEPEPRQDAADAQAPAATDERPVIDSPPTVPTPVMYSPPTQHPAAQHEPAEAQQSVQQPAQQPESAYQPPSTYQPEPVQQPEPASQPEPVQQPAAVPQQQAWMPTHTVPPGGVPAWAAPDPAQPPVTQLPPGLPVRLVERRGGWARIEADNGWSGWVDGRPLPDPPAS